MIIYYLPLNIEKNRRFAAGKNSSAEPAEVIEHREHPIPNQNLEPKLAGFGEKSGFFLLVLALIRVFGPKTRFLGVAIGHLVKSDFLDKNDVSA